MLFDSIIVSACRDSMCVFCVLPIMILSDEFFRDCNLFKCVLDMAVAQAELS